MALFPTYYTLTQGSPHYRLATLAIKSATPTALTRLFHNVVNIYMRMNKWWIMSKRYNTYSVEKYVLIYYLWHNLLEYH